MFIKEYFTPIKREEILPLLIQGVPLAVEYYNKKNNSGYSCFHCYPLTIDIMQKIKKIGILPVEFLDTIKIESLVDGDWYIIKV